MNIQIPNPAYSQNPQLTPEQLQYLSQLIAQQMQQQQQQQGQQTGPIGSFLESGLDAGKGWIADKVGGLLGLGGTEAAASAALPAMQGVASATPAAISAGQAVLTDLAGNAVATAAPWATNAAMPGLASGASGATGAAGATTAGMGSLAGGALGAAGVALGTKMALDANKIGGKKGMLQGGLGGLTAGIGGAGLASALIPAMSMTGPVGLGIMGAALLAGTLAGARLGDKDKFKSEGKALSTLRSQGYGIPDLEADNLKIGRTDDELIAEAQATGGNVDFAKTRSEATLKPTDIVNYASIWEKAGKTGTTEDRYGWAKRALESGAVNEHHGTIDVDWTKVKSDPFSGDEMKSAKTDLDALGKLIKENEAKAAAANPLAQYGMNYTVPEMLNINIPTGPSVGQTLASSLLSHGGRRSSIFG